MIILLDLLEILGWVWFTPILCDIMNSKQTSLQVEYISGCWRVEPWWHEDFSRPAPAKSHNCQVGNGKTNPIQTLLLKFLTVFRSTWTRYFHGTKENWTRRWTGGSQWTEDLGGLGSKNMSTGGLSDGGNIPERWVESSAQTARRCRDSRTCKRHAWPLHLSFRPWPILFETCGFVSCFQRCFHFQVPIFKGWEHHGTSL